MKISGKPSQYDHLRRSLAAIDRTSRQRYGMDFADSSVDDQDAILVEVENGTLPGFVEPARGTFFELLRAHLQEGLFCDPVYRGNRDKLGWRTLGHPGVWLENSEEENLTNKPVTKGGRIQSLADLGLTSRRSAPHQYKSGYDPHESILPPSEMADVIVVGVGGVGGVIAPVLASCGLKVVGFESGPWRTSPDYIPDELGATYYCRSNLGPKFVSETPRWRKNDGERTQIATFSSKLDFEPAPVAGSSHKLIHIPAPHDGPVAVMIDIEVDRTLGRDMLDVLREVRLIRLRNGAFSWRLHEDLGRPNTYRVEMMYSSWTEFLLFDNRLRALVDAALEDSGGLLRLAPCWVPRSFLLPGSRLRLHPDDLYAFGLNRGGIDERWFSSTIPAIT